ncbi:hypothetical protein MPH_04953 [Macrophomina phaseolina MS6]|uniref:Uncharacterized protein n=1 Tax=Macrophomina phaseolina (strain MS6) TaxID=1126212 RepID=K2R5Y8_MACPH|nr:hypothetical protein MPH_04953 [Macrophomina phaseolina MS6]
MPPSRPSRRSNARASASSPDGSHAANSPAPPVAPPKEKGQSSLDSWIEPPPRTPVPSFEDVGFERQGVLTTMQPLGVKPTAKDRARSRVEGLRRSMAGRNGQLSGAEDSRDTPDADGAQHAEDRDRNPQDFLPVIPPNKAEEEDDDYMPANKKKKSKKAKSHKRGGKSETPVGSVRPTAAPSTPENRSPSPLLKDPVSNVLPTGVEKALRGAFAQVETTGKVKIGVVLRRLSQQGKKDKGLAELLDYVAKHNGRAPSKEKQAEFNRYVKRAKKASPQDQEEESIERSPKRARILRGTNGLALTPTQSAQSPSPSSPGKSTTMHPSSAPQSPASGLPSERTVTPPKEAPAANPETTVNGLTSSAVHSPRSRRGSMSSISSLSSVDETIAAGPPPDALVDPSITRPSSAAPTTNGISQLGIRTKKPPSKKSQANVNIKRSSDDAGLTESEDEELLEARRQQYTKDLYDISAFNSNIPLSDIRPGLSQTEIPPLNKTPILAPPKKQTLRLTNGLLKRSSLQASSSAASPLSEGFPPNRSGSATRATTPNLNADGNERPSKRQKTSARTKHS